MSQHLLKDLNELVSSNIISAETARQIESYYENKKAPASNRFTTVLGMLGAMLLGLGLILVIAHNWDELSRPLQTLLAFAPLAIGQGLCLFTLIRRNDNQAMKEGSAVFLLCAIASCIALISQVYQVNGSLEGFLLTWILLGLPLVYIMSSSVVSLLIIALATWYACLVGYSGILSSTSVTVPYWYLGVLAALVPYYYRFAIKPVKSNSFHLHNWVFAASCCITLGTFIGKSDSQFKWVFIAYIALFGIYYLIGSSPLMKKQRLFANPFTIAGTSGIIIIFLCWSFKGLWNELTSSGLSSGPTDSDTLDYTAIPLLAICLILFIRKQKRSGLIDVDLMALSPFIFTSGILLCSNSIVIGLLLFNAWILALSVFYIRKGAARDHLGILNFGLLILASLAILRFFDSDIPFVWRGLIFLVAGAGFFGANYMIMKKRKQRTALNAEVPTAEHKTIL